MSAVFVGTLGASSPQALAERAISMAEELSKYSPPCVLRIDGHKRMWVSRVEGRRVNPAGWVATFTKKSDPDWLAEEIEGAMNG